MTLRLALLATRALPEICVRCSIQEHYQGFRDFPRAVYYSMLERYQGLSGRRALVSGRGTLEPEGETLELRGLGTGGATP